jgi:hypothetical protein
MKSGRTFLTKTLFALVLLFGLAVSQHVYAATYYVDSSITDTNVGSATPDCTNYDPAAFTCSGGSASAYKTIADINAFSALAPGDSVLFRKGQTWREELDPPSSGSAGSPITFGAFGSGANPIISGANIFSSWTQETESFGTNFTTGATQPVGWWRFGNSGSLGTDSSSAGNTLAVNGAISQTTGPNSYVPNAAVLDSSSNQSFSLANSSLSAGFPGKTSAGQVSVKVGAWVKPGNSSYSDTVNVGCSYDLGLAGGGNTPLFNVHDNSYAGHQIAGTTGTPTGAWSFVVGIWTQLTGALTLYVNGVNVTPATPATSATMTVANGDPFELGAPANCNSLGYYDGAIAEPFVFSTALTQAQVQSIYNYGLAGAPFNTYYTSYSTAPNQVFEDGTKLTLASSKSAMTPGTWWLDTVNSRIYIRTFQDASPSGHTIEASQRSYGINVNGASYITVENLQADKASYSGIMINGPYLDDVVSGNNVTNSGGSGIQVDAQNSTPDSGATIVNNTTSGNGFDPVDIIGVSTTYYPTQTLVQGNVSVGDNGGFECDYYSDHCSVFENLSVNSTAAALVIDGGRYDTFDYNIVLGAASVGFQELQNSGSGWSPTNNSAYGNTLYGNSNGVVISNSDANLSIKNNLVVGTSHDFFNIQSGATLSTPSISNNLYYGAGAQWLNGPTSYSTLAAWQAALATSCGGGQCDANSLYANPLFTNGSGSYSLPSDLALQSSSPAIDAGVNLGSSYQLGLAPGSTWPSSVSTLNQNTNGLGWDIGAFVYTETTAPAVSLTAPNSGATVSGSTVALSATASDNSAVTGVQFKLDTNTNIGAEDTSSPYSVTWDSTGVADGTHTIIAVARDTYGNYATSSPVTVTVDNTAPVRSAGSPSGTLALNTTSTTLSLTTNEAATCKYSTSSGTAYGSMTAFTTTGSTSHSKSISGVIAESW